MVGEPEFRVVRTVTKRFQTVADPKAGTPHQTVAMFRAEH